MERNTKRIIIGVLLVVLATPTFLIAQPHAYEEQHEYNVKAEVVSDDTAVADGVSYENLSSDERDALFRAFKKNDHFLGSSTTTVRTDEQLSIETNEWKVVRVNGVPILMAIMYAGSQKVATDSAAGQAAYLLATIAVCTWAGGAALIIYGSLWLLFSAGSVNLG